MKKLDNFTNCLAILADAEFQLAETNDIYRTGIIGQFNLTFELAWKALQEKLTTAKKALKALKDGTDPEEVASQYMVDSATYSGKETLITTKKTDISTRMINKLYKTKKAGVIDEIFTNESSGTTYAYVAVLVTNTYKDIKDEVYTTLSSDDDVKKACLVYYLKKYNFEVHDQDVFDNLKTNNPEYLVSRPDLAKSKD